MALVSLETLFINNQQALREALRGLTIPKDAEKIQTVISSFLSQLLLDDGEFRQNLTQSEDYILQAVLAILNAQQARYTNMPKVEIENIQEDDNKDEQEIENKTEHKNIFKGEKKIGDVTITPTMATTTLAAGAGAIIGSFLGTWGAVCGAIACTALAAYYSGNSNSTTSIPPKTIVSKAKFVEKTLDVDMIIEVIRKLTQSVDQIIVTFRAQINNVVQKYENQEKPSIEREYSTLLEEIQTLIGYSRAHGNDEKFNSKIQERIAELAESLENYKLSVVDFNGNNTDLFDMVPSSNALETKQVFPAIVKEVSVVLKGKVFIPEK